MGSADAELVIEAWRKNLIMKDTLKGMFKIPINALLDEQVHTGMMSRERWVKRERGKTKGNMPDI